ncbi:hypothetical protein J4573_19065 [Actinomadura barringtoniae]|uniref:Uncharacterized protein n=1 Tax=Actinomadura barringtoniae TaxID=1427535 RepID=A0A939T4A4_9ACTN|nr:hypothetical protein [Actinomadura barringtoniae]MBO2449213.1 hypothetical protein [Actinomadura barringtoniae]
MSLDRARHTAMLELPNRRNEHLAALLAAVCACRHLEGGFVESRGARLLFVVRVDLGKERRSAHIGCDFIDCEWWLCRADDGQTIAPAHDLDAALVALTRDLSSADDSHA